MTVAAKTASQQRLEDKVSAGYTRRLAQLVKELQLRPQEGLVRIPELVRTGRGIPSIHQFYDRNLFCQTISWAVPSLEALEAIKAFFWAKKQIVEIGAGLGLWSYLLQRLMGVDIIPVDLDIESEGFVQYSMADQPPFTEIHPLDSIGEPDALLFCWPSYDEPWAAWYLQKHMPGAVAYIGEGCGGCTADETFHEILYEEYVEVGMVSIPTWGSVHDRLTLWRKKD